MKAFRRSLTGLSLAGLFLLAVTATATAADPTGTWTWSTPGRDGQPARKSTLKLKMEGEKLTGTISGRQQDTAISDATLKGDEIAFKVVREFQGNKMTQKYAGKISGDTIKGKIEFEWNGEAQSRDWEAKKEAAKPAEPAK